MSILEFPAVRLQIMKRREIATLADKGKVSKALALKHQVDGASDMPRVVPLFSGRRLNILLDRIERGLS